MWKRAFYQTPSSNLVVHFLYLRLKSKWEMETAVLQAYLAVSFISYGVTYSRFLPQISHTLAVPRNVYAIGISYFYSYFAQGTLEMVIL